jgi:hypothetical protein
MVDWLSGKLAYPWVAKPMAGLRVYEAELARALQAAEGGGHAAGA